MFRTAMRLLGITGGAVLVDAESIADKRTTDLVETFGYVFQSPSQMLFARTVEEELLFGPRMMGRDPETFEDSSRMPSVAPRSRTSKTSASARRSRCRSASRSGSRWPSR